MEMKTDIAGSELPCTSCDKCATRELCLLYSLPTPRGQSLKHQVTERTLGVGEAIEQQGTSPTKIGVVKVGLLKGLRSNGRCEGKPVVFLGRGRVVGLSGVYSLPSQLSFVAAVPARVCELDLTLFNEFALSHNTIHQSLLLHVGSRVGCISEWSRILREETPLHRLCNALQLIAIEEGNPAFRLPSHADLANLLGSRRETIARSMAALIKLGKFRKTGRCHGVLTSTHCDF
jgi:CRP/FNR family transcriptional regulator